MFMTPREALLDAENRQLKAKLEYLTQAFEYHSNKATEIGVIAEREFLVPHEASINIPLACSIEGALSKFGRYHILATLRFASSEDLKISYYADAAIIKSNADFAINRLLPDMHERFIRELAKKLKD